MLDISSEKVAYVIIRARELAAKVSAWDGVASRNDAEDDPVSIMEDFVSDATRAEVAGFIKSLNDDEQAQLVALAWVPRYIHGRGIR